MRNPYKLDGPTCLSFSGGRTSGYMLFMVLISNTLEDISKWLVVLFCNTGKEDEATLRFVRACADNFGCRIVWLEYRSGSQFAIVDFDTASRNGEPFDRIIEQRGHILPNPRSPYCSSELKTRTMHRYLRSIGFDEWTSFVGIRADEPVRVARFRANPSPETPDEEVSLPLADAMVGKEDVSKFWSGSTFDLELLNDNGVTPEGNCDLCFKKHPERIKSLIFKSPQRAIWWAKHEKEAEEFASGDGCRFRNDRPSYAQYMDFALRQGDMVSGPVDYEDNFACFCGD